MPQTGPDTVPLKGSRSYAFARSEIAPVSSGLMKLLLGLSACAFLLLAAACGDDDATVTGSPTTSTDGSIATLSGLQAELASVVLQQADVPDGLERSAPIFTDNQQLAGPDEELLAKVVRQGRQLGVEVQFLPTERLDPASPLRGGVISSASVYIDSVGASESYQETASEARTNDWKANYPDFVDPEVTEMPTTFGDESVWIRTSGEDCTNGTPTGAQQACNGEAPALVVVDNIVMRIGRTRAYLQVATLFPTPSERDVYVAEVSAWAQLLVQHAQATFPVV